MKKTAHVKTYQLMVLGRQEATRKNIKIISEYKYENYCVNNSTSLHIHDKGRNFLPHNEL